MYNMFRPILLITLLALGSLPCLCQTPGWFSTLEDSVKREHPDWIMKTSVHHVDSYTAQYNFTIESGKRHASVEIFWYGYTDLANVEDTFRGLWTIRGKETSKIKEVKNDAFGDEARQLVWRDGTAWALLMFRRDKTIINLSSYDEDLTKDLASLVDRELMKK